MADARFRAEAKAIMKKVRARKRPGRTSKDMVIESLRGPRDLVDSFARASKRKSILDEEPGRDWK